VDWTLEVVPVPVADVDRAKRFYSEQVGFSVDHDTKVSDEMRVVQLTPPGSGCSIVISVGLFDTAPGSIKGLQLVVADLDAARSGLAERGVDVSEIMHFDGGSYLPGRGGEWNSFIYFDDPDGNSWAVQERPAGR
jgi:predicted enzyme related to lactoylglutathione lyase